jgi:DNA-binding GntR family transcriptional regulator
VARERRGRSLAEDVYDALRADILFGRRLPASRVQLNEIAEEHGVNLRSRVGTRRRPRCSNS